MEKKKIYVSSAVDKKTADNFRKKVKQEGYKIAFVMEKLMELYASGNMPVLSKK